MTSFPVLQKLSYSDAGSTIGYSSEDFMRRGGLRFSLSLIVSELWRHQWRHNERCGLHPRQWTT